MSPAAPTSLYVLVGNPVAGNPTQEMLEAAFGAAGLAAGYASLDVEPDALRGRGARVARPWRSGAHVTVPHKVAVVPLLDRLTEAARLAGAVNCIKREGGELVGDNTDGRGFPHLAAASCGPARGRARSCSERAARPARSRPS